MASFDAHKNFAYSLVATAPSPATSGTSLVVTAGEGTKFPTVPFNALIWPTGVQPTTANAEIVRVTGISTDTFTITRAQESTAARSVIVGDQICAVMSAKIFTDIENMILDGWIDDQFETWTYASASTFTVPGDQTARFTIGTKLKFTQTSVKYAVVLASSYSAPNTTVTIMVNTDYTIANAAISANYHSYATNPQGWPGWFNLTAPTWNTAYIDNGSGGQPTTTTFKIMIEGRHVIVHYQGSGTKVATNWYCTFAKGVLPIPLAAAYTVASMVGEGDFQWASNDHDFVVKYTSANTNDEYSLTTNSADTIADNQALSVIMFKLNYEI
jgi:hypothetical protein